jgi:hypothetical protein
MAFSTQTALVLAAVGGSVVALVQHRERLFPVLALVASGLAALMLLGVVNLSVKGFPIMAILGGLMLVTGGVIWARGAGKWVITGATVIALVGLLEILRFLNVMG